MTSLLIKLSFFCKIYEDTLSTIIAMFQVQCKQQFTIDSEAD